MPKIEAVQGLWNAYRQTYAAKGIDLNSTVTLWATREGQKLPTPGPRIDFDELCRGGCATPVLAFLLALLRFIPHIERIWSEMFGGVERRTKVTQALEIAASTIESVFEDLIVAESHDLVEQLAGIGRIPPSHLAAELRVYAQFLTFAESLAKETNTRSVAEVGRYLLTAYVNRSTRRFRDRNVSGLLGAVLQQPDYDEVSQRMWRHRNYSRLDSHFSTAADFLLAVGLAITDET